MAYKGLKLFSRFSRPIAFIRRNIASTIQQPNERQIAKPKEYKTENNFVYLEDPDTFGTLTGRQKTQAQILEEEGDIKEQELMENIPLKTQKLTIKQYADLIKQNLKNKRLKEAIDVLEVRMLTQDRVKPENYIYNILIGACADVGYTKKAFRLYNDMKRRSLTATGDTYTCLFNACANSPWASDGLKNAHHLRTLMNEKGIKPNLTNYNAMIKAFGRCRDLITAFKIVDEMISNKIKIRVHTFNHLLHACIADKNVGLKHALFVWRKMLQMREKPNIYSFNLMLKCVKECNLGSKEDIEQVISIIQEQTPSMMNNKLKNVLQMESSQTDVALNKQNHLFNSNVNVVPMVDNGVTNDKQKDKDPNSKHVPDIEDNELSIIENESNLSMQFIKLPKPVTKLKERTVPNLLSRFVNMQQILSLQEVHTPQDKFAVIGGQEDFLKEMEVYSVEPDIKTFTQMLFLIEDTKEAEDKLLETIKISGVKTDIDFYNMLIKKRCLRSDYDGAFEVKEIVKKESEFRKKRYQFNKKLKLKPDIMTYGVLAMACKTKESAEALLNEMKEKQLKLNIEILGTLLKNGTVHNNFGYVLHIMNIVKQENVRVNDALVKHLEAFNDKCANIVKQDEHGRQKCSESFVKSYKKFLHIYRSWLKEVNVEEALQPEHPWKQFRENYPETLQRPNIEIVEPKRFYKRNRKFVRYAPPV